MSGAGTASGPVLDMAHIATRPGPDFVVALPCLRLNAGDIAVLESPSGSGKSTVLGLVAAVLPPEPFGPGQMRHELIGRPVAGQPRSGFARADRMGFIVQTNTLVPYLNLRDNIELPVRMGGQRPDPDWRDELVERLGLAGLERRLPSQLSVGQRQRASIARALLGRPSLLLLDEPVSALDPVNVTQVETLLIEFAQRIGAAMLLASHQAGQGAFAAAPRAVFELTRLGGTVVSSFTFPTAEAA